MLDFKKAHALAIEKKLPLLAVFSAEWCGPCQLMIKEVYPLPEVKAELKNWITVYVDTDVYPVIGEKFKVVALPTTVLFSPGGIEEYRWEAAYPTDMFLTMITTQRSLVGLKAALAKAPEDPKAWKNLAVAYDVQGRVVESLENYEKARYYDPKDTLEIADNHRFQRALKILMGEKSKEMLSAAYALLDGFETTYPKSDILDEVHLYQAMLNADLGDLGKSIKMLKEGIIKFPDSEFNATRESIVKMIGG